MDEVHTLKARECWSVAEYDGVHAAYCGVHCSVLQYLLQYVLQCVLQTFIDRRGPHFRS